MRLPKRVPWSNLTELEQICSWIYADADDISTKILAINRLSAWKASTALPHALESSLSLLTVIIQDESYSPTTANVPSLLLRQSYALALIRLVNGLVDPLQQGFFARSIATIAAQIGLPLWLVELRHASTHEDLPSLELLREGARDAMSWLLHNYFLPTLSNETQFSSPPSLPSLPSLAPLFVQYKRLLKTTTRDVSLESQSKPELAQIFRDFDRWIIEAEVMAPTESLEIQVDRQRWALERFCDALISRGGIVPVSKRKRPSPLRPLTIASAEYISLWTPLIMHMHSHYSSFPSDLLACILASLLPSVTKVEKATTLQAKEEVQTDATYDQTLATWALWIVRRWGNDEADCNKTEVLKKLFTMLGRRDSRAGRALVTALSESDTRLSEDVALLTSTLQFSNQVSPWEADSLETMSSRLSYLVNKEDTKQSATPSRLTEIPPTEVRSDDNPQEIRGWKLLQEKDGWKPCPIGVFVGSRSDSS